MSDVSTSRFALSEVNDYLNNLNTTVEGCAVHNIFSVVNPDGSPVLFANSVADLHMQLASQTADLSECTVLHNTMIDCAGDVSDSVSE